MKKKGFTLLELLAVIIILAVIALITAPIVLNVVDEAKKSAFQDSAYGIVKAIEYDILEEQLAGNNIEREYIFPYSDLEINGKLPEGGSVTVDKNGNIKIAVYDGKYCAIKGFDDSKITITEYVDGECGEKSLVYYMQPYNFITADFTLSIILSPDGNYLMYANGVLNEEGTYVINNDYTITVDDELNGIVNEEGTQITINVDETTTYIFTLNTEKHDLYYNNAYGNEEFKTMGIDVAFVPYEDGIEVFCLGIDYDYYIAQFLTLGSLDGKLEIRNNMIYADGEIMGIVSMDGTQIFLGEMILSLNKQEVESSWLTIDQTISGLSYNPTFVNSSEYILSGSATSGHALSSIIVNGEEVTIEDDGTWSINTTLEENVISVLLIEATDTNGETTTLTRFICNGPIGIELNSGNLTFAGYKGIENERLVIPESITGKNGNTYIVDGIDGDAFNQDNLISITIPSTVRYIGRKNDGVVGSGKNLKEFIVSEDNAYLTAVDGVLYNKNMTLLQRYPEGKLDTHYVMPNSVTYIEYYAFEDCINLVSITLSDSVDVQNELSGLDSCINLKEFIVSENSAYLTTVDGVLYNKDMTTLVKYPQAKIATHYVMPDSVIYMYGAFVNSVNLTSITISAGVEHIYSYDFIGCEKLQEIIIDEDNSNFSSLDGVLYDKNMTTLVRYPQAKISTVFVVPDGVEKLGYRSFEDCINLTKITIPGSVTVIDNGAFDGCNKLVELVISPDNESYSSLDGVLYTKDMTGLIRCLPSKTGQLIIPSGVTYIANYAFESCVNLTGVVIPVTVIDIGYDLIRNCPNFKNVYYTGSESDWENITIRTNIPFPGATITYNYLP